MFKNQKEKFISNSFYCIIHLVSGGKLKCIFINVYLKDIKKYLRDCHHAYNYKKMLKPCVQLRTSVKDD